MNPEDVVLGIKTDETRTKWLNEALTGLSLRERTIISKRLMADKAMTLDELGRKLGVSKERIRQIEQKALRKLRHPSRRKKLQDYLE